MQIYAYVALNFMLNLRNYANYAVCSHSAIMPESNAGIIGLAQIESSITHLLVHRDKIDSEIVWQNLGLFQVR